MVCKASSRCTTSPRTRLSSIKKRWRKSDIHFYIPLLYCCHYCKTQVMTDHLLTHQFLRRLYPVAAVYLFFELCCVNPSQTDVRVLPSYCGDVHNLRVDPNLDGIDC